MARKHITLRAWDENPNTTQNFSIITKYSDLGESLYEKKITGVYMNLVRSTSNTSTSIADAAFNIWYRSEPVSNFNILTSFTSSDMGDSIGNIHLEREPLRFNKDIVVDNIQLKIEGLNIKGDYAINDFGLIFRTLRSTSSKKMDD